MIQPHIENIILCTISFTVIDVLNRVAVSPDLILSGCILFIGLSDMDYASLIIGRVGRNYRFLFRKYHRK